ncbi:MAG: hypothetical protein P8P83_02965 [Rickettsiaceae bacterium]|nr:hypothetical protein [Rickettsiaceae bacterium]
MTECNNLQEFLNFSQTQRAQITKLVLGSKGISTEGAALLAEALKTNNTLTYLDLRVNRIGAEGAALLAEALKTNTTLKILKLALNNIGTEGAETLKEALQENSTLTKLELYDNNIDYGIKKHLIELLDRNKLIEEAVLNSLKKIAANDDVVDVDITKIPNIKHIESIKNPIINALDRYLDNEAFFKKELQKSGLSSYIQILDAKADIHKASQLLKTEDIKADETEATVETNYSKLHTEDILGNIGSYLTAKDAMVLKITSLAPKKASENP